MPMPRWNNLIVIQEEGRLKNLPFFVIENCL